MQLVSWEREWNYRIRQKIRGIKFSPIAHPLYWGKIFTKFNFANRIRSPLQEVAGGGQEYRIVRMHIRCRLFTAALAAAIAGDDSSHNKSPVGLGRSRGAVLKYLKIDILTVERERERVS